MMGAWVEMFMVSTRYLFSAGSSASCNAISSSRSKRPRTWRIASAMTSGARAL